MNEQEQMSQLSALFDNELPPAEAELVIRRTLKDPALRARWERYALIGACLRKEPLHVSGAQPDVADRVRAQLATEVDGPGVAEQAVVPYPGQRRAWSQFGRGAMGGAIAAGVAAIAIVLMRSPGAGVGDQPVQMANVAVPTVEAAEVQPVVVEPVAQVVAADNGPAIGYTTPVDNSSQRAAPLVNYVGAHSEVAASVGRILPASAAMNGSYDITQGTVPMTEAEIRPYR